MIICPFCYQKTVADGIVLNFPACHSCNVSYETDNEMHILNMLFLTDGPYSIEIDLKEERTILWNVQPNSQSFVKQIMVFNYVIPIIHPNDIEYWISRLLNLKAFS